MNEHPNIATRFRKGNPGGPGRTPNRQRLARNLVSALVKDFDAHGQEAVERLRHADPVAYLHFVSMIVGDFLPGDMPGDGGGEE
jgi:hypothetical protein